VRQVVPSRANELLGERGGALESELARRKDDQFLERRLRALRHGIERAKRLDLIAEELDARGLLRRRRIDVDDPAAARERARLADLGHRLVAEIEEPRRRLRPRKPVARPEGSAAARELLRRNRVLQERAQARDDGDRGVRGREPPEREKPLMHGRAGRRARFERHRLALGERQHAILTEPTGELRPPAPRPIFARCDERDRARVLRDERRPCKGARTRRGVGDG